MAPDLPNAREPSVASLVGGVVDDAQLLIKQELALAKREVTDELTKAKAAAIIVGIGVGIVAEGGLLLVLVLVYLLHLASPERLPLWGCGAIVGATLVILGGGVLFFGMRRAGAVHLLPEQTIATMKEDVAWIKNQT